jgi:hypothetical protein
LEEILGQINLPVRRRLLLACAALPVAYVISGANSVLVGWILRRRIRIFLPIDYGIGQKPRVR